MGEPDVGGFIQMAGASFVQDLDRTKPLGVLITIENNEPKGVGFVPVPDLDKVLKVLRDRFSANVDDLGDGVKKLELGKGAYLKQQGEYLFFSDQPKHLTNLPADPVADARRSGQAIQRGAAVLRAERAAELARSCRVSAPQPNRCRHERCEAGRSGARRPVRRVRCVKRLKESVNVLINQSDQVTMGWAVDSQGGRMHMDLQATAVAGSSLAEQWSGLSNSRSSFTGFVVDDAAATFQGVASISPDSGEENSRGRGVPPQEGAQRHRARSRMHRLH